MNILVLQHHPAEHPGALRQLLREDGHQWQAVALDAGEPLPADLGGFDALWAMGGPMDVWQRDEHPWLREEIAFIREAVAERGMPYLGLCLGHQLLAEALGGEVGPAGEPEIGVCGLSLTQAGADSILLDGLPPRFEALQWHSAEVTRPPADAAVLACSPACEVQVMQWGPCAVGAQFHLEVEADTVDNWAAIPAYRAALVEAMGESGVEELRAAVDARAGDMAVMLERFYINWMQCAARA